MINLDHLLDRLAEEGLEIIDAETVPHLADRYTAVYKVWLWSDRHALAVKTLVSFAVLKVKDCSTAVNEISPHVFQVALIIKDETAMPEWMRRIYADPLPGLLTRLARNDHQLGFGKKGRRQ